MSKKSYYLLAFLAYFIWGMTFPFSKLVIPPLSSINFVFLRALMGFIFLFSVILVMGNTKAWWDSFKTNFWGLFSLSLIPFTFAYVLQFYAIQFTTSTNQSIIGQTSIFWVMVLNFIFFQKKPTLKFLIGVIIGLFGVFLILTKQGFTLSNDTIKGDLLSLLAFMIWASYTAFSKPFSQKMSPIFVVTSVFLFGGFFLAPLAFIQGGINQVAALTGIQVLIMLYLGIVCTGIAYLFHMIALSSSEVSSEYVVYFSLSMPFVAGLFGILFLDEVLTPRSLIGGILVLVSVAIVLYKPKSKIKIKQKEIIQVD